MRSPDITRPEKIAKIYNGGSGPPDNGPDPNDGDADSDSSPSTLTRPSEIASPTLVNLDDVLKDNTSSDKLTSMKTTLDKESLIGHQMFTPAPEEYKISTPVSVSDTAIKEAEKLKRA